MIDIESILETELAQIASAVGGKGTRFVSKRMKTTVFHATQTYTSAAENAAAVARCAIENADGFIGMINFEAAQDPYSLVVLLGSGFSNMNPTVICVDIEQINSSNTKICISGYAKEGLIRQKSAEKAVKRIFEMLEKQLSLR